MSSKPKSPESRAALVAAVEKQFGRGALVQLGGAPEVPPMVVIPSGSADLDRALGVGGYPRGRVTEVFGPAKAGKTTLALHAIAQVQAQGGVATFIDAGHALDLDYARKLGVRVEELLVSQPDTAEQAMEIVLHIVASGVVDLIIIDSVDALVPRAEVEGEVDAAYMGLQARLMSQALRKLTTAVSRSGTCVIFLGEPQKPGSSGSGAGNALKFYSSVRCEVRRAGNVKEGEAVVGSQTRVKVVKNKCAPPFQEAEFAIIHGQGIRGVTP